MNLRESLNRKAAKALRMLDPATVGSDATVGDAISLMQRQAAGCVVVTEHGGPSDDPRRFRVSGGHGLDNWTSRIDSRERPLFLRFTRSGFFNNDGFPISEFWHTTASFAQINSSQRLAASSWKK